MSVNTIGSSIFFQRYGVDGQATVNQMLEAIQPHLLTLAYNDTTDRLTVQGSAAMSRQRVEELFAEKKYRVHRPQVLEETDGRGNHVMRLLPEERPASLYTFESLKINRRPITRALFEGSMGSSFPERGRYAFLHSSRPLRQTITRAQRGNVNPRFRDLRNEAIARLSTEEIRSAVSMIQSCYPGLTLSEFDEVSSEPSFCLTFAALIIAKLITSEIELPLPLFLREDLRNSHESPITREKFAEIISTIQFLRGIYSKCPISDKLSVLIDSIKNDTQEAVIQISEEIKIDPKVKILEIANLIQKNPIEIQRIAEAFQSFYPHQSLVAINEILRDPAFCITFAAGLTTKFVSFESFFFLPNGRFTEIRDTLQFLCGIYSKIPMPNKFSLLMESIKVNAQGPVIQISEEKKTDLKVKIFEIANVIQRNPLFIATLQMAVERINQILGGN
jgi:hypothetical protein